MIEFDIPGQDLNGALLQFAVQAGVQIFYESGIPTSLRTAGVRGAHAPEHALRTLLSGTGLGYVFTSDGSITVGSSPAVPDQSAPKRREQQAHLGTLVVAADPLGTEADNMAVRTILIHSEDIEKGGFRSAFDVLQGIEGLYAPLGEGAKHSFPSVTLRGLGSGYFGRTTPVIFLLNGHNMTGTWGAYFSFADLHLIPLSMIERIEIVKGPFSSVYGSGALGGVINIVTRQGFEEGRTLYAELSAGSEEYLNYEAWASGRSDYLNWKLWAGRSESDSREYFKEDWQQVYGEVGKGTADINRVGLSALVDLPGRDGMHVLAAHENRRKNISDGRYYGNEHFATTVLHAKYTGAPRQDMHVEFNLSYNYSDDWEPYDFGNGVPVPLRLSDQHHVAAISEYGPSEVWGFKGAITLRAGRHTLTPGAEFRRQRTWWANWAGDKELLRGWTEGRQTTWSAFIEDAIDGGRWAVTPSLRVDLWETEADVAGPDRVEVPWDGPNTPPGNTVSVLVGKMSSSNSRASIDPKLRAAYFLDADTKLRGALGTTFRAPSALEIYNYDYSTVQDYAANAELEPERVTSAELGADRRWFDDRLSLSGTVFYTAARDRIEFAPDPVIPNTKKFQNMDSRAYGMELAFDAAVAEGVGVSAAAALTRSRYRGGPFDRLDVPLIPDLKANVSLSFSRGSLSARLGADFIGERTIVNDPSVAGTGFPVTVRDEPYVLVDASVRIDRKLVSGATAFVKLWGKNLLDEDYMVDGFFVYLEPLGSPNFEPIAQGRTIYATAGVSF